MHRISQRQLKTLQNLKVYLEEYKVDVDEAQVYLNVVTSKYNTKLKEYESMRQEVYN